MDIYKVGGSVRDEFLGIESHDHDFVVVGSTPSELRLMGLKQVGADFPVFLNEAGNQYALARRERKTGEGYLGFECDTDEVTIEEDLYRRDFTVNAIAKHINTGKIIDPFGGRNDIKNKVIKLVSAAFIEDPLRVVRLCRFAARFKDWTVDRATMDVARGVVARGELNQLPDSRLWAELVKTFEQGGDIKILTKMFRSLDIFGIGRCRFYSDLFTSNTSGMSTNTFNSLIDSAQETYSPDESIVIMIAGIRYAFDSPIESTAVPTRIKTLVAATTDYLFKVSRSSNVYQFIKRYRLDSTGAELVPSLCKIERLFRSKLPDILVNDHLLVECIEAAKAVKASDYPEVAGRELGELLDRTRTTAVANVIYARTTQNSDGLASLRNADAVV